MAKDKSHLQLGGSFRKHNKKVYPQSTPEEDKAMIDKWLKNNKVKR